MTYIALTVDDIASFETRSRSQAKPYPGIFPLLFASFGAVAVATALSTSGPYWPKPAPASYSPPPQMAPATAIPTPPVRWLAAEDANVADLGNFPSSGAVSVQANWIFDTPLEAHLADEGASPLPQVLASTTAVEIVPLPLANPLMASRGPQAGDIAPLSLLDTERPVVMPLPPRNPLLRGNAEIASIQPTEKPLDLPPRKQVAGLPTPGSGFALYDIKAGKVYMPNGERLEAHSGYGESFDNPRHADRRMRGPTPPNTYSLKMREALFHGVEAIRMTPAGDGKMYGRDGILAHTYMLGARGDSNGCISFKDYGRFLSAFKRGEVSRIVVVAQLEAAPPANPLLSWLMPD